MQQTRRQFLRGLLATVATGALVKGGVVQPEEMIMPVGRRSVLIPENHTPKRRVFDMAENTWRDREWPDSLFGYPVKWVDVVEPMDQLELRPLWPMEWNATINGEWWPETVNCACIPGYEIGAPITAKYNGYEMQGTIKGVSVTGGVATIRIGSDWQYANT